MEKAIELLELEGIAIGAAHEAYAARRAMIEQQAADLNRQMQEARARYLAVVCGVMKSHGVAPAEVGPWQVELASPEGKRIRNPVFQYDEKTPDGTIAAPPTNGTHSRAKGRNRLKWAKEP
jgi:hypothetical protein